MVRAILEDRKSMTRRIVKPDVAEVFDFLSGKLEEEPGREPDAVSIRWGHVEDDVEADTGKLSKPQWLAYLDDYPEEGVIPIGVGYGNIYDGLWVKETFAHWSPKIIKYRADGECSDGDRREHYTPGRWRPSIFMPRWASRILLEITNVRVERLQEITREDAIAEGCEERSEDGAWLGPEVAFCRLWESINGPGSWEANPWVWVVEFKKLQP
jgi:hypothetical protein